MPAWAGPRFYSKWMKRKLEPSDGTVDLCVDVQGDDADLIASPPETYAFLKANEHATAILGAVSGPPTIHVCSHQLGVPMRRIDGADDG
jgi:hypothetical protein